MKISRDEIPPAKPMTRVHGLSLGTGASEFIPVPFLDEWVIGRQRRSMVKAILRQRGITFESRAPSLLSSKSGSLFSRLGNMTRGLLVKPFRKLFRTVFFWLTVRDAARTSMESYFLARVVHHRHLVSPEDGNHLDDERAKFVGTAFREVAKGIDLRAAKDAYRQLCQVLARSKKTSGKEVSETIEKTAPGFIAEFDALIGAKLAGTTDAVNEFRKW